MGLKIVVTLLCLVPTRRVWEMVRDAGSPLAASVYSGFFFGLAILAIWS